MIVGRGRLARLDALYRRRLLHTLTIVASASTGMRP